MVWPASTGTARRVQPHPSTIALSDCCSAPVDNLAALPRHGLSPFSNFALDALAQVARVHRVEFPATRAKIGSEPFVARVLALVEHDGSGILGAAAARAAREPRIDFVLKPA